MFGERNGKHLAHRPWFAVHFEEEIRTTVFPQQLSASTTWCDGVVVAEADHRDESTTATHVQRADHRALGAQRHSVRSILDVASSDDATVINQRCRTDAKVRVRGVGMILGLTRC
jgi:hypothetical protein